MNTAKFIIAAIIIIIALPFAIICLFIMVAIAEAAAIHDWIADEKQEENE